MWPLLTHLWLARGLSVVEIIVMNAEEGVQVRSSEILQAQSLKVIYLLHQTCRRPKM